MDVIVFSQDELLNAISDGAYDIYLCDNTFSLPSVPFITYTAIGKVSAKISLSDGDCEKNGIRFFNFIPKYAKKRATPLLNNAKTTQASFSATSLKTSYAMSFATSFKTSFRTSFITSFNTSFRTSFRTSFNTSFRTSFRTSYSLRTSFSSSFRSSFAASFSTSFLEQKNIISFKNTDNCILVNGYGINLI